MSKQKKEQQKKRKKEQVRKERLEKYRTELTAKAGRDDGFLEHVFDLTRKTDYKTARGQLLAYVEKYPKYPRPYAELAKICAAMEDYPNMYWATEQLLQVGQRTFEDYLLHQSACVLNNMPAVLIPCVEYMQRRFQYKNENDINEIREEILSTFKSNATLSGDDLSPYSDEQLLELMRLQERTVVYLPIHRFEEAIKCCEEMTARFPFFVSGYTNKALAMMTDWGPDKAEPLLQQAIEKHPHALFVIAFKIRQLALLGKHEEIPAYCERLDTVPSIFKRSDLNHHLGKIEAFVWADDLNRVIEAYQLAKKELEDDWDVDVPPYALATHHAAVAYARLGDHETAIRLWKLLPPGLIGTATENLEDIQKPVGERNGPWFFNFEHWVPRQVHSILRQELGKAEKDKELDEEERNERFTHGLNSATKKILSLCPSFDWMLIAMLKRGAPDCYPFVQMFIGRVDTPNFRVSLLDFVQGTRGSDERRNAFSLELSKRQWLESNTFRMYIEGEQRELQFFQTEIYYETEEPDIPLSPEGGDLFVKAQQLTKKRDCEGAVKILTQLNEKESGHPSVLYNLAANKKFLGDDKFFDDTIDQLRQDFPDYFFAKTAYAQRLCIQRRIDEAWEVLKPLQGMRRLHISEYRAYSISMIMFHLVKGEKETAESLHKSSVEVCGDRFPSLEQIQDDLDDGFVRFERLLKNLLRPQ